MRLSLLVAVLLLIAVPAFSGGDGQQYQVHCSFCHGQDRLGKTASPLLPQLLMKYKDEDLASVIKNGLPATQMPAFPNLSDEHVKEVISYVRKPMDVSWTADSIEKSIHLAEINPVAIERTKKINNIKDVTAVVERGKNKVWIMQGQNVLDWFEFPNVHGGAKFTTDGKAIFIPSRDGYVAKYDLSEERYAGKARACVNLRNIAVSRDGKYIVAACLIPQNLAILDSTTFKPVKTIDLQGRVSAIYELNTRDQAIFTISDRPQIGILNTKSLEVESLDIENPYEDFFIEPIERYVIGSSRKKNLVSVYDLQAKKIVFRHSTESMPHLASASFWYDKGGFYFATPHINKPDISIWRMYNWEFIRKIPTGGDGFFVRTSYGTPFLWIDNGSDTLVLIEKKGFAAKHITPVKGKKATHTEFSGDGKIAYISVFEKDGELTMYDSTKLTVLGRIKASQPVGKYNFVHKQRTYEKYQLGQEVFMEKCWGCHHTTEEAFGPSFKSIVKKRNESTIRSMLIDPKATAATIGYKRSVMPKIDLSTEETESLLRFVMEPEAVSPPSPK
ncbi:MAG: c-type cytochrome [Nitrospirae bacterium]|nr:c-type cytochrome [Nitrospirota bacterium]